MAPRHPSTVAIDQFAGVDQFNDAQSLPPASWPDSLNVVVGANGNAVALRSPANYNDILFPTNSKSIMSGACYDRIAGFINIFDTQTSGTTAVSTFATTTSTNTLLRLGQANARWQSQNVNDRLYRVNGTEFIQYVTSLSAYRVGIDPPAAAPTASMTVGTSTLTIAVGVTVSYAYYNSVTTHTGEASPVSASSGAGTNQLLRIAVVASTQTGVDKIVLFITEDAGSVRYLVIDANGDPILYANSTGNIDISAPYLLNYNVEETVFNVPPVLGATHISLWKSRLIVAGYTSTTMAGMAAYSGFDQISMGQPWETWPPLNLLPIPAKAERLLGGIDTPVGWLGLSAANAFLLTGAPTDKVDSGVNVIQVSEQFRQLGWQLGTRSILTLQNTPFGTIFLDQNKHLQFWSYEGQPTEIVMGLRPEFSAIQNTDAARAMAEGAWFPSGDNVGFYVLTGSTSGSANNRLWVITFAKQPNGQLLISGAPSDIAAQCVFISRVNNVVTCVIGVTDRLRKILDFDTAGAGWASTTQIYFDSIANNASLFSTLHNILYDGTNAQFVFVQARDLEDQSIKTLQPMLAGGSYSALVNAYGRRQKLRFNFATDDSQRQEILNLRLVSNGKKRTI